MAMTKLRLKCTLCNFICGEKRRMDSHWLHAHGHEKVRLVKKGKHYIIVRVDEHGAL